MRIAVDFDGVIHKFSKGWHDGTLYDPPTDNCAEKIQCLIDQGHDITIFSARVVTRRTDSGIDHAQLQAVLDWLKEYKIPYHSVWIGQGKVTADIYIDDRAIRFDGNWDKTLEEVNLFNLGENN